MPDDQKDGGPKYYQWGTVLTIFLALLTVFTIFWCLLLGSGRLERASLALVLCASSFCVGSALGFMFSIFGDEQQQFGKIQDAMIALGSGIAGAGLARAAALGRLLGRVPVLAVNKDLNSSFSNLTAVTFFVIGFFFMYFYRKLAINPALAEARGAIDRLQQTGAASRTATAVTERLSQSLLLGRQYIDEVEDLDPVEANKLREELFAEDVNQFLVASEQDVRRGISLPQDNVALAARLNYYRVYFQKDDVARSQQESIALEWIRRALIRDPGNPDLQIKMADILALQEIYKDAVSILERLERDEDSPQYVQQWLGYFLLFIDGREEQAIRVSLQYHERFPDDSSSLFNAACGYAQLYQKELSDYGTDELRDSDYRRQSLALLGRATKLDPELRALARKHSVDGDSFEALRDDGEFIRIIADQPSSTVSRKVK